MRVAPGPARPEGDLKKISYAIGMKRCSMKAKGRKVQLCVDGAWFLGAITAVEAVGAKK